MATVNFYSKEQIDEKIPDTAGASQGDVLTIGADGTEWATPSGGVTRTSITSTTDLYNWLNNANIGDILIGSQLNFDNTYSIEQFVFELASDYNPGGTTRVSRRFAITGGRLNGANAIARLCRFDLENDNTLGMLHLYGYTSFSSFTSIFDVYPSSNTTLTNVIGINF